MIDIFKLTNHHGRNLYENFDKIPVGSAFNLQFDSESGLAHLVSKFDGVSTYSKYHVIPRESSYLKYFESLICKYVPSGKLLELGCNSGELLERLSLRSNHNIIGIDPTIHASQLSGKIDYIETFFNRQCVELVKKKITCADGIIVRHVLEHVEDYNEFIECINEISSDKSVLFLEVPDFYSNLVAADITPIFCEHLQYFSLPSLQRVMNRNGWYISEYVKTNYWGGTIIAVFRKKGVVIDFSDLESTIRDSAKTFASRVGEKHKNLLTLLRARRDTFGDGVAMWGIGNRALHLLAALPKDLPIDHYFDNDEKKCGLYIPLQEQKISRVGEVDLSKIHTVLISAFGYEDEVLRLFNEKKLFQNGIQIMFMDPHLREVSLY